MSRATQISWLDMLGRMNRLDRVDRLDRLDRLDQGTINQERPIQIYAYCVLYTLGGM